MLWLHLSWSINFCFVIQNTNFSLVCFQRTFLMLSFLHYFLSMEILRTCKYWEVLSKQAKVHLVFVPPFCFNSFKYCGFSTTTSRSENFLKFSCTRVCACECVRVNLTFIILRISIIAGCAFVKYETKEQALGAVEALNGKHTMEVCIWNRKLLILLYVSWQRFYCSRRLVWDSSHRTRV